MLAGQSWKQPTTGCRNLDERSVDKNLGAFNLHTSMIRSGLKQDVQKLAIDALLHADIAEIRDNSSALRTRPNQTFGHGPFLLLLLTGMERISKSIELKFVIHCLRYFGKIRFLD